MPVAGGAYDQDPNLTDAVSIVDTIIMVYDLDAGQQFKLPTQLKRLRKVLYDLVFDESY